MCACAASTCARTVLALSASALRRCADAQRTAASASCRSASAYRSAAVAVTLAARMPSIARPAASTRADVAAIWSRRAAASCAFTTRWLSVMTAAGLSVACVRERARRKSPSRAASASRRPLTSSAANCRCDAASCERATYASRCARASARVARCTSYKAAETTRWRAATVRSSAAMRAPRFCRSIACWCTAEARAGLAERPAAVAANACASPPERASAYGTSDA